MDELQQNVNSKTEDDLDSRIQQLEVEKKEMLEEFNMQRAKLKELFLHKENELNRKAADNEKLVEEIKQLRTELNEVKSQLVIAGLTLESDLEVEKRKAKEEIASLQQLVHETVEESTSSKSIYDTEVKRLQIQIQQLQQEVAELKNGHSPHHGFQDSPSPSAMITAVTKRLVRKLGADTFASQDGMDESMRKVDGEHAQEDAEVLRSLVIPLEEEIKALKDKLRATDEELQRYKHAEADEGDQELIKIDDLSLPRPTCSTPEPKLPGAGESQQACCDMCSNYEAQLVKEQQRAAELEAKVAAAEKATERHREELLKEIGFRKDMEEKWNEKKEEHKQQVGELTLQVECAERDLKELRDIFKQKCSDINEALSKLTKDRQEVQNELVKLQNENDNLIGKYTVHSQQLQSEIINLPNSVEELHELLLKSHQDLIIAKLGKEAAEEECNGLKSQILLLEDRITNDQIEKTSLENNLVSEIDHLKKQNQFLEREKMQWGSLHQKLEQSERNLQAVLTELRAKYNATLQIQEQLERQNNELRTQIGSLQQELDTSETVQKDFVKLSQSLQIQLEKIRDSDTQVRWQHDEDVDQCPACHVQFLGKKGNKMHCRHCGTIFCHSCLSHTVPSGPNMRPSRVCDVCHTLLVKSSAPYFSETPPQN